MLYKFINFCQTQSNFIISFIIQYGIATGLIILIGLCCFTKIHWIVEIGGFIALIVLGFFKCYLYEFGSAMASSGPFPPSPAEAQAKSTLLGRLIWYTKIALFRS